MMYASRFMDADVMLKRLRVLPFDCNEARYFAYAIGHKIQEPDAPALTREQLEYVLLFNYCRDFCNSLVIIKKLSKEKILKI